MDMIMDKIRGSLFGGAVGDALGYPVEFMSRNEILRTYGENGITAYDKDKKSGLALISDDTQMTLFTAYGVIRAALCGKAPHEEVSMAYLDWLTTQTISYAEAQKNSSATSWLLRLPELFSLRAPGNTCLNSLRYARRRGYPLDVMETRMNTSKGCGGIMRVAPLALLKSDTDIKKLDYEGAVLSALTHGHALGFMPAAVVTHILRRIVYPEKEMTLKEIVMEARDTVAQVFSGYYYLIDLIAIINKAIAFSENDKSDEENIRALGEGWVAEETLAIALYCSLRYQNDFSKAVTVAANHDGDSDSTGAVTGNILGALVGYEAIKDWTDGLELADVLMEIADDLYVVGTGKTDAEVEGKYAR